MITNFKTFYNMAIKGVHVYNTCMYNSSSVLFENNLSVAGCEINSKSFLFFLLSDEMHQLWRIPVP